MINFIFTINVGLLLCVPFILAADRPNIVFFLTDDQDVFLGSLEPMEKTQALIGDQGARLENAFVTTALCCPSRSSILTGLYVHSHGTINNTRVGGCSGPTWQSDFEPITYGARLQNAGYRTYFSGKYLNMYSNFARVPPGWDWWAARDNAIYYNYNMSVNGTVEHHGNAEEDYFPDVLKAKALEFLSQSYVTSGDKPFLMVIATPTPHAPFTPAKRHQGAFAGKQAPRTPNFNIPATNRKHWMLRQPPEILPDSVISNADKNYQMRWEALLAVDELVEAVVNRLDEAGVLDNTYVFYYSDHGFHFAQFGQAWGKRLPYEFDIRVPGLVRGPGITPGSIIRDPIVSIDLAPTFMDIAGIPEFQNTTDGVSFLPKLLQKPTETYDRSFFVEHRGEGRGQNDNCWGDPYVAECLEEIACKCRDMQNNTYTCIRHVSNYRNDIYCRFEDEESFAEFYDINVDPHEMDNLARPIKLRDTTVYEEKLACYDEKIAAKQSVSSCL